MCGELIIYFIFNLQCDIYSKQSFTLNLRYVKYFCASNMRMHSTFDRAYSMSGPLAPSTSRINWDRTTSDFDKSVVPTVVIAIVMLAAGILLLLCTAFCSRRPVQRHDQMFAWTLGSIFFSCGSCDYILHSIAVSHSFFLSLFPSLSLSLLYSSLLSTLHSLPSLLIFFLLSLYLVRVLFHIAKLWH